MKKTILTVLAISLTLSTGCAEQFLEDNGISLTAEELASTVTENNDLIPVVETSSEATDLFLFTVTPEDGVKLKSMYPLSYADVTAEDVKTVSTYYDNRQLQFYDIYIDMLNSGKYNKVYNVLYDRTSHIYGKYADSSSYPNFGEYYYSYVYNPAYQFLKEKAFDYTAPSHISPILLSDKFFEFCADGLDLKTCRYSTDYDNRRFGTNTPYSVNNITSYHSYDSRYDIESAVSGALDHCSFETSDEENLSYVYLMNDTDSFFNVCAIYLKFSPENTLYSIGIDYCSWAKDFFMNADVLSKGLDYTPGVPCAEDVFVKNGFMEMKDTLTKFLNSSTSESSAFREENVQVDFDYTTYYVENQNLGDLDQYYHIMAWYTLEN